MHAHANGSQHIQRLEPSLSTLIQAAKLIDNQDQLPNLGKRHSREDELGNGSDPSAMLAEDA